MKFVPCTKFGRVHTNRRDKDAGGGVGVVFNAEGLFCPMKAKEACIGHPEHSSVGNRPTFTAAKVGTKSLHGPRRTLVEIWGMEVHAFGVER